MPMLMKYEHLCFYLIPSANRGTNKGFLDSCHYNFLALEECHYYSLYWKIAITILHTSHTCPHLRLLPLGPIVRAVFAYWPVLPLFHLLRQRREAAPT